MLCVQQETADAAQDLMVTAVSSVKSIDQNEPLPEWSQFIFAAIFSCITGGCELTF